MQVLLVRHKTTYTHTHIREKIKIAKRKDCKHKKIRNKNKNEETCSPKCLQTSPRDFQYCQKTLNHPNSCVCKV